MPTEIEEIVRIDITQVLHAESFLGDRLYKSSAVAEMGDRLPLGTEVGLGPGNIVLDGDPAPPRKRAQPHPIFGPRLLWPNGWMDGTEVDLGPGHIALDGDPAPLRRGAAAPPLFSAHIYCGHGRPSQLLLSSCSIVLQSIDDNGDMKFGVDIIFRTRR